MAWRAWFGAPPAVWASAGQRVVWRLPRGIEVERLYGTRLPVLVMSRSTFEDEGWIVHDDLGDALIAVVRWRDGVLLIRHAA